MPIVSVDLVVVIDGGVVLARRRNKPAKGEWFVPGGRVRKGERLRDAVRRVAATELGIDVTIEQKLGTYQHFYDEADVGDCGKHYLSNGFLVRPVEADAEFDTDDQHDAVKMFEEPPADLHQYVKAFLRDADVSEETNI